jgi:hypothetical protein
MPRRLAGFLAAGAAQLVALVLAHELVFLARYGSRYGEALVHAGHGETWSAAVSTSLLLAAGLAALAALRLAHLGLLVRRRAPAASPVPGILEPRPLMGSWLRIGPRTALLGAALLTIQENLERAALGQAMPGPGILLSAEYPGGLWIAIAVGLAVGLVAALFEWRRRLLLARLREPRAGVPRGSDAPVPRPGMIFPLPVQSILGRWSALRAPPSATAA